MKAEKKVFAAIVIGACAVVVCGVLNLLGYPALFETDTKSRAVSTLSQTSAQEAIEEIYEPWDVNSAPNYYLVLGPAELSAEVSSLAVGEFAYAPLDELGRATGCTAKITYALIEQANNDGRDSLDDLDPTGWGHNEVVSIELMDGSTYTGWFWNRSHLIADSLGGCAELENLVCGTRMQNVGSNGAHGQDPGGMAYTETKTREWLYEHTDGYVCYSATPIYQGDDLVCRAVIVDVLSCDGELDLHVIVYNAALGYKIDYATGEFQAS